MECIQKTEFCSWKTGTLPQGCKLCVQGRKLVLFITGLCGQRCFYCPVSEHKFGKDVAYANEWKIPNPDNPEELFKEAELTGATGAGITGGDPLVSTERCCKYITLLKERFGKKFHIHLYTPLKLVTLERLQKLHSSGLDEIRLHPDLDDDALWDRINLVSKFEWAKGIEIPAVPGYDEKIKKLIDFVAGKVDFINLNELELSDTTASHYKLDQMGYKPKDEISYGVAGSKEMGIKMLKYALSKKLSAHFCTAKLKDSIQLKRRIQLRAENVALQSDIKTEDGLLLRGCAYLQDLMPGIGYREKLKTAREGALKKLAPLQDLLIKLGIKEITLDEKKPRFLMSVENLKKYSKEIKKLKLIPAIVEEYPTEDSLEAEVEFL